MDGPGSRSSRGKASSDVANRAHASVDEALVVVLGLMRGAQAEGVPLHAARLGLDLARDAGRDDDARGKASPEIILIREEDAVAAAQGRHRARMDQRQRGDAEDELS